MNPWLWCGSGMGWMWIFPVMFFTVMLVALVLFWRRGSLPWCGMMGTHSHETPRQILDRRYAGGEITREQYDQMKRDLG